MTLFKNLASYLNVGYSLVQARVRGRAIPFMLEYQINRSCNLSCKYCYADLDSLKSIPEPPLLEIKENIDKFYHLGTRVVRLLGGEPLMREDIGDIIDFIKKKKMFVELATNGTLIYKRIDQLKNLDILQISIDGSQKSTDAVRGAGVYERVIEGIETAVHYKLPVRIHGVYNRYSCDADQESPVQHLAALSKKYDIPFNFCPFVADFSGAKKDAYISLRDLVQYHQECLELKQRSYKYFNSVITLKQMLAWPDLSKDVLLESDAGNIPQFFTRCLAGEMYCFLDADGSLYPCVPLWKRGLNIKEAGIPRAWEYVQKARKKAGCFTCASIGDMEFSRTLSLDFRALIDTAKKVVGLRSS